VFFEKWNGNENPKKKISAKRVGKGQVESGTTKWDKLGQVGVRGTSGTRRRGLQILVGQVGQGKVCLQIFVGQVGQGQGPVKGSVEGTGTPY